PARPPFELSSPPQCSRLGPLHAKCDLIASLLNPNRSFSATLCHKTEVTSKFVLAFNTFGAMMGGKGALQGVRRSETGSRSDAKSTGGGHGKDDSKRRCAPHGVGRIGRSRRVRAQPGEKPVRSVPARALLHARTRSQMARQARPGARCVPGSARPCARARQALTALKKAEFGQKSHHPPRPARPDRATRGSS